MTIDQSIRDARRAAASASIQPHGFVVALSEPALTIEAISENVEAHLGVAASAVCGSALEAIVDGASAHALREALGESRFAALHPYRLNLTGVGGSPSFECLAAPRAGGGFLLECEPLQAPIELPPVAELEAPIDRLAAIGDIEALLAAAARELREISGFQRVLISRLETDRQGEVVAEAAPPDREAEYFGRQFGAFEIPEHSRAFYLRSALRVIPDTHYIPARLVYAQGAASVDLTHVTLAGVPMLILKYLRDMGSRAAFSMPLTIHGRPWGIVSGHDPEPRALTNARRMQCEMVSRMLAWQVGLRIDSLDTRRRRRESMLQTQIDAGLESQDDLVAALVVSTPQLLELFSADGIAVRIGNRLERIGNAPRESAIVAAIADALASSDSDNRIVKASHELATLAPKLRGLGPAGALCIRLAERSSDVLLVFRPEMLRTVSWGGARVPAAALTTPPSANAWRQTIHNQSRVWTPDDFAAAERLANVVRARLKHLPRSRGAGTFVRGSRLDERNAQAEALIALQDDIAAALPSRAALIAVILDYSQRATRAAGTVFEILDETTSTFQTAAGSLAEHTGLRVPRLGSLSAKSCESAQTLICNDVTTNLGDAERALCERLHIGSMLVVPVTVSPGGQGVLKVVSPDRSAFSDDEAATLKLAGASLEAALRAAHEFAALAAVELEQRTFARQMRALHAIAGTTTGFHKDQIDAALHLGLEQLDLQWAFFGVIDHAAEQFVIESSVSRDGAPVVPEGSRLPLGKTLLSRIALTKRVTIVEDVSKLAEPPLVDGWTSYIAVPLFVGDTHYGAIGFTSRRLRSTPFSEANVEFLAVAGELIASAIERGLQRERLESNQNQYRALIEAIPQKMWVVDAANAFEYVNERWTHYTGRTLEQLQAGGRDDVFNAADFEAAGLNRPLPAVDYECEIRLRRADGAFRWHLIRSVPFGGAAGQPERWLVTATDIEARKSAQNVLTVGHDAALAATEAKSRFLATMSHEVRTPMNGVIGMTELLLLTSLNDEQREYTEVIRDSGLSLLRVLNDILDYSKIEAGKLELERVQFDLPGQIESVVGLLRPGFAAAGVRLSTHIAPDVRTTVVGDPGRLRQILLNLAGNALKFTAAGGSVRIDVSTAPGSGDPAIRFAVKDTGIGMAPDVIERLFTPFSQGDESTTRKYGGTGLGLSISAELVALMGGEIGVESRPAVGSEFWFVVPFRPASNAQNVAEAQARQPMRSEPAMLRDERILLVEDNEINTFLAVKQLQRLGFAVSAVSNGREAVETVECGHYDLVLMDCHMPEMDGFEATRAIRKREAGRLPHLPIVAMTADARDEDHQNCLSAGMDDFVSKPTNLESLKAVLDRWIPAPERRRASRAKAAAISTAPILGMSMLLELFNGDRYAVFDLLAAALSSLNGDLRRIENASLAADAETVIEAAHRLKGTSGSIRAARVAEIAAAVETEARAGGLPIGPGLLNDLRAAVSVVVAEVRKQRKTPDSSSAQPPGATGSP